MIDIRLPWFHRKSAFQQRVEAVCEAHGVSQADDDGAMFGLCFLGRALVLKHLRCLSSRIWECGICERIGDDPDDMTWHSMNCECFQMLAQISDVPMVTAQKGGAA
jgi:hypothetical protein